MKILITLVALFALVGCSTNTPAPTKKVEVHYMPSAGWPSGKSLPTKWVDVPYKSSEGVCTNGDTNENAPCS